MLIYEDQERHGAFVVRLTDFGCARLVPAPPEARSLVYLPESKPWTIPSPEYHHRGFGFSEAVTAMVYSFGVCCLWILLYNHPSDTRDCFIQDFDQAAGINMRDFAYAQLLQRATLVPDSFRDDLRQLFSTTLAPDPRARAASVDIGLQILHRVFSVVESAEVTGKLLITEQYERYPGVSPPVSYSYSRNHPRTYREDFTPGPCLKFNVSVAFLTDCLLP